MIACKACGHPHSPMLRCEFAARQAASAAALMAATVKRKTPPAAKKPKPKRGAKR